MMTELMESPRWLAVGLLLDQHVRDVIAKRYGLLNDIVSWFKVIDIFRETENERMVRQNPTASDLRYHKTWLASLIADGERLVTEIQRARGLPENSTGLRVSDVEAAVESLRVTDNAWHSELVEARRVELWKGVFHVEEPGAKLREERARLSRLR